MLQAIDRRAEKFEDNVRDPLPLVRDGSGTSVRNVSERRDLLAVRDTSIDASLFRRRCVEPDPVDVESTWRDDSELGRVAAHRDDPSNAVQPLRVAM